MEFLLTKLANFYIFIVTHLLRYIATIFCLFWWFGIILTMHFSVRGGRDVKFLKILKKIEKLPGNRKIWFYFLFVFIFEVIFAFENVYLPELYLVHLLKDIHFIVHHFFMLKIHMCGILDTLSCVQARMFKPYICFKSIAPSLIRWESLN